MTHQRRAPMVLLALAGAFPRPLAAQISFGRNVESWISQSVVHIEPAFGALRPSEEGFGFVVRDMNDTLYIVTAHHVLSPEPGMSPEKITVRFFQGMTLEAQWVAVPLLETQDVALLQVPRPSGFTWFYRGAMATEPRIRDKVRIVGRSGNWDATSAQNPGRVTAVQSRGVIIADFNGVRPGSSGGPMFNQRGILGMVLNDEGDRVTALSIDWIKRLLDEWQKAPETTDLPFVTLAAGVGGVGAFPLKTYAPGWALGWEPALQTEIVLRSGLGLGLGASLFKLGRSTTFEGRTYKFRNTVRRLTATLRGFPGNAIRGEGFESVILGVARAWMNPRLQRPDDQEPRPLNAIDPATFSYGSPGWQYILGAGYTLVTPNNLLWRYELQLVYSPARYVAFDTGNPSQAMTARTVVVTAGVSIGYVFRPAGSQVRILR